MIEFKLVRKPDALLKSLDCQYEDLKYGRYYRTPLVKFVDGVPVEIVGYNDSLAPEDAALDRDFALEAYTGCVQCGADIVIYTKTLRELAPDERVCNDCVFADLPFYDMAPDA